ncbi:hypothetical protein HYDPIDRAFT_105876 [Hydnomerulius pinastri MD-312]|nr:hypothetical protein HYDPIDRAFT_105876 [Hydnomerulius pinastri MD-312]
MLRSVVRAQHLRRASLAANHRSFVSTVLLSRTWENETVVDLRKEAKARGLSTKGNKSTLITRIQEYEESRAASTSHDTPAAIRNASTNATPGVSAPAPSPATPLAASPGIPPAAEPPSASVTPKFMAIKLPDLSKRIPDAPVQVPYVPDFWDSARPSPKTLTELEPPKLHVVSGTGTHPDGGPTHNLEKHDDGHTLPPTAFDVAEPPSDNVGFWRDLLDDMGFPKSFSVRPAVESVQDRGSEPQNYSRPLNGEEKTGLYVLLGILAGSWVVGGIVNPAPAAPVEEEEHVAQDKH